MNWTTKTIDECCDFLAECNGWIREGDLWNHPTKEPHTIFEGSRYGDHPIPATLDAIAGALPEGFWWDYVRDRPGVSRRWFAQARRGADPLEHSRFCADGDSELLARARAACMAWEAVLDQGADVAAQARGNRRAEE